MATRKVIVASPTRRMPIYGHVNNGLSGTGVPVSPPGKAIVNPAQRRPIRSK